MICTNRANQCHNNLIFEDVNFKSVNHQVQLKFNLVLFSRIRWIEYAFKFNLLNYNYWYKRI